MKDGNRRCIRELDLESRIFFNSKLPRKYEYDDYEREKYDYVVNYDYDDKPSTFAEQFNRFSKKLKRVSLTPASNNQANNNNNTDNPNCNNNQFNEIKSKFVSDNKYNCCLCDTCCSRHTLVDTCELENQIKNKQQSTVTFSNNMKKDSILTTLFVANARNKKNNCTNATRCNEASFSTISGLF
jgi:hypothetical protein